MIPAIICAVFILTALYFSPNIRKLTDNKRLQSVFHIVFVLVALLAPILVLPVLGLPVYVASLTGKYMVYLGIPLIVFVLIKKVRARNKQVLVSAG